MHPLADDVSRALRASVVAMTPLRGGDVADAYRVQLSDGTVVFAKTHRNPPPNFFATEAAGLQWLRDANALRVPEVLAVGDGFLVLSWIEESSRGASDEADFGRRLASLHQAGAPSFGREDGRTTGSRGLPNEPCASWVEFFATQRLIPIARLMPDAALAARLDGVAARLAELAGAPEPPARLHGDLWAGNRLVDTQGVSWLIDPACFGGHREFDLAMMRLFGGFGEDAFAAYDDVMPLQSGWQQRVALHQLAPLAIHAIKFGGSYFAAIDRALRALGA